MTLLDRIKNTDTTCPDCGTTVKVGDLADHRAQDVCHPSWHETFPEPGVADPSSDRPSLTPGPSFASVRDVQRRIREKPERT